MSAVIRDLRTAPNLAREVVRVLDRMARDEARGCFTGKRPDPLPADADWLTRHHYNEMHKAWQKQYDEEQARSWAEHNALLGGSS